ncbi:uncharacterized protein LOC135806138 [Sycon ciliatum]|uniref:uncharacterized protein LOC135806138 n=1 Tax=Sycon ciliatum TaxID=27933 RepID=UPI0031F6871D
MPAYRGEGVAIVLLGLAQRAWKNGGCQWRAVSSRVVVAKLLFGDQWLHVISCYAPTFARPRHEKEKFYGELRDCLLSIPERDLYVVLGDFNARVGSCPGHEEDAWRQVRGPYGVGTMNEAGEELLSFLSMFNSRLCNTYFKKKDIHKVTWQHPRSQHWHCIDYVITRQRDFQRCTDCRVYRSAECGTDHKLVGLTLSLGCRRRFYPPKSKAPDRRRFDVSQLGPADPTASEDDDLVRQATVAEWYHTSSDCLQDAAPGTSVQDQWSSLRDATVKAATSVLGKSRRRQPDWFSASSATLEPLLAHRNTLFQKSLADPSPLVRREFVRARSAARDAVRSAKEDWFRKTASDAESRKFGCKAVWNSIRDLQTARRGLIPTKSCLIKQTDGSPCSSVEAQQNRWSEHFENLLNLPSGFVRSEIDLVQQRNIMEHLATPPTAEEAQRCLRYLTNGKAAGSSGILPEMVKYNCDLFYANLFKLITAVWEEGVVPQDWVNAEIIPIPKKGDLTSCDNWRGIALLDVIGKLFGRLLQNRLQKVAESVLPESQCGFRKGRSCTDMTFVVRQVVEKCHEHQSKGFLVFVDLRKAYDSVPRAALWIVLLKLGVPEQLVSLLKSFHDNMTATIIVNGSPTEGFPVCNGLRQGCTMAPVLFNLFAGAVMERWCARVQERGVSGFPLRTCADGQLFKRSKRGNDMVITDGEFADDAALFAPSHSDAQRMLEIFAEVSGAFGLSLNMAKTVFMAVGHQINDSDRTPLSVQGNAIQHVSQFTYLGSVVTPDGRCHTDVSNRIAAASKAFGSLYSSVFRNTSLTSKTKQHTYTCCVLSVLLYGAENWTLLRADIRRLEQFHNRCVRVILGISRSKQWEDHLSSASLHRMCATEPVADMVARRRLQWLGHIARMDDHRLPKTVLFSWLHTPRPAHGPRRRWRDVVRDDLKALGLYTGCPQLYSISFTPELLLHSPKSEDLAAYFTLHLTLAL